MEYLGRYGTSGVRITLFSDRSAVAAVAECDGAAVVQAFARLVVTSVPRKGFDVAAFQATLATHNAAVEIATTTPTRDAADASVPKRAPKIDWLESSLRTVDRDLADGKRDYETWRGVRDLDEAHENLRRRNDEIFDLNQKLIANEREPQLIYSPGRWVQSAWQTTDRVRFHELKDQAKERASAIRQRIDFSRRTSIRDLEEKRRSLVSEIEDERKRENARDAAVTEALEESVAARIVVTVRSPAVLVKGRRNSAVRASLQTVATAAAAIERATERAGLSIRDADFVEALSPVFAPNVAPTRTALLRRDALEKSLGRTLTALLAHGRKPDELPDLSRFPSCAPGKRLAYLGHASATRAPIFVDLDEVGPRHVSISGGSGSGKSVTAHVLIESAALYGVPVVVFDPTRSWTGLAVAASGSLLERYEEFSMKREWARPFDVRALDVADFEAIDVARFGTGLTIVPAWEMKPERERAVAARLLAAFQKSIATWPETRRLRAMLVFEEAHRYVGERELADSIELFARTARAKGLGLVFVSQNGVDLPPGVRNNSALRIQMQSGYGPDLTRAAQVFGSDIAKKIPALGRGQGAVNFPEYGSALVTFRPPLHSPHAVSTDVWKFFATTKELSSVLTRIMSVLLPPTTVTEQKNARTTGGEAPRAVLTRTWHDVGNDLVGTRGNVSVSELTEAIRTAGLKPPTERTLYRFLRRTPR